MTPFDGPFANSYVLPLAIAAYDATIPPPGFDKTWEIVADQAKVVASVERFSADSEDAVPSASTSAFRAMTMQPPTLMPSARFATSEIRADAKTVAPNLHFGWVCADVRNGRLSVAIRGTQFFKEWLKDFDFVAVEYEPIADAGLVHQGFQLVYNSIRASLQTIIAEAKVEFPQLRTFVITGHSLGAAVVGLAAPDLIKNSIGTLDPIVYTLAEPRVGHPNYKGFYDSIVPICYRIDNFWDIVPHFPPLLALYEHEGEELIIDSGFSFDVAHNHELATGYVPGLAKWVQQHPTIHSEIALAEGLAAPQILVGVSP
jgi:hypothetical protein